MKLRSLALPALAAVVLFLGSCNKEAKTEPNKTTPAAKASMGIVNSKCPMKGEPVDKDDPTIDYHGQKVAFCCSGCLSKFNKLTDEQKAAKIAAAK